MQPHREFPFIYSTTRVLHWFGLMRVGSHLRAVDVALAGNGVLKEAQSVSVSRQIEAEKIEEWSDGKALKCFELVRCCASNL